MGKLGRNHAHDDALNTVAQSSYTHTHTHTHTLYSTTTTTTHTEAQTHDKVPD